MTFAKWMEVNEISKYLIEKTPWGYQILRNISEKAEEELWHLSDFNVGEMNHMYTYINSCSPEIIYSSWEIPVYDEPLTIRTEPCDAFIMRGWVGMKPGTYVV